jgi:hypothetical protein
VTPRAFLQPIRWWKRHFLVAEFALALVVPLAFALWIERAHEPEVINSVLAGNRGSLYGTLASVFGALLGFVITTLSIVIGFSGHERLQLLKKSEHYKTLWRVFTSATWALGAATVVPVTALLLDRDNAPARWLVYLVLWTTLLALLRVLRCVWVLEKIVAVVTSAPG